MNLTFVVIVHSVSFPSDSFGIFLGHSPKKNYKGLNMYKHWKWMGCVYELCVGFSIFLYIFVILHVSLLNCVLLQMHIFYCWTIGVLF